MPKMEIWLDGLQVRVIAAKRTIEADWATEKLEEKGMNGRII